jgi:hypothetical protein
MTERIKIDRASLLDIGFEIGRVRYFDDDENHLNYQIGKDSDYLFWFDCTDNTLCIYTKAGNDYYDNNISLSHLEFIDEVKELHKLLTGKELKHE